MRPYVERGTVKDLACGMWFSKAKFQCMSRMHFEKRINENGRQAGYPGRRSGEVSPNSVQGYDYEADGNGIVCYRSA